MNVISPQEIECGVSEAGEGMPAGGVADAAVVLAEIHVAKVVEGFDLPVSAPVREQRGSVSKAAREAGDSVDHLDGFFAVAFGRASKLAGLSKSGPIIVPGQAGTHGELPPHLASVLFGVGFNLGEMLLPIAFRRGGKSRAENPPRWLLSGSVDCP